MTGGSEVKARTEVKRLTAGKVTRVTDEVTANCDVKRKRIMKRTDR